MVYTFGIWGEPRCPGRSVSQWTRRLRFIARLLEGEKMAALCREFGISARHGLQDLQPLQGLWVWMGSRIEAAGTVPTGQPAALPDRAQRSSASRKRTPHLGRPQDPRQADQAVPDQSQPAVSTIHAVLDRHGLVKRKKRRRYKAQGTPLVLGAEAQRAVVRRLQGRVHARQQAVLLPAHHLRLQLSLPAGCEGVKSTRQTSPSGVRKRVQGLRPAQRSAPTTACRLPPAMRCLASPGCPSGGCAWASACSASSPATRSKTAATSACT